MISVYRAAPDVNQPLRFIEYIFVALKGIKEASIRTNNYLIQDR